MTKPMMPRGFRVYKATNLITKDIYIGVTSKLLSARKNGHIHGRKNTRIAKAIKKYGPQNFSFDELYLFGSQREAWDMEILLIAELNPAYNVERGGVGCKHMAGKTIPSERKERISKTLKARWEKSPCKASLQAIARTKFTSETFSRKVKLINDGRVFMSCKDASKVTGLSASAVSKVARGEMRHARGMIFSYAT